MRVPWTVCGSCPSDFVTKKKQNRFVMIDTVEIFAPDRTVCSEEYSSRWAGCTNQTLLLASITSDRTIAMVQTPEKQPTVDFLPRPEVVLLCPGPDWNTHQTVVLVPSTPTTTT